MFDPCAVEDSVRYVERTRRQIDEQYTDASVTTETPERVVVESVGGEIRTKDTGAGCCIEILLPRRQE